MRLLFSKRELYLIFFTSLSFCCLRYNTTALCFKLWMIPPRNDSDEYVEYCHSNECILNGLNIQLSASVPQTCSKLIDCLSGRSNQKTININYLTEKIPICFSIIFPNFIRVLACIIHILLLYCYKNRLSGGVLMLVNCLLYG